MRKPLEASLMDVKNKIYRVPWNRHEVYGDFLAQTYYFVCHSTRLLALAASRFQVDQDPLFRRFASHISEENAHERLALSDLKNMKLDLEAFPEKAVTRAFYEAQYYKVERQNPTALLGYILFLEALAVQTGPFVYDMARKAHGETCARFLKVHVEEDPDHVNHALDAIESRPPHEQAFIEQNLWQSQGLYGCMIDRLGVQEGVQKKAA